MGLHRHERRDNVTADGSTGHAAAQHEPDDPLTVSFHGLGDAKRHQVSNDDAHVDGDVWSHANKIRGHAQARGGGWRCASTAGKLSGYREGPRGNNLYEVDNTQQQKNLAQKGVDRDEDRNKIGNKNGAPSRGTERAYDTR